MLLGLWPNTAWFKIHKFNSLILLASLKLSQNIGIFHQVVLDRG